MKKIIIVTLLFLVGRYLYIHYINPELHIGYFYPSEEIRSEWLNKEFNDIELCKEWVDTQFDMYTINNPGVNKEEIYLYGCGYGCVTDSYHGPSCDTIVAYY